MTGITAWTLLLNYQKTLKLIEVAFKVTVVRHHIPWGCYKNAIVLSTELKPQVRSTDIAQTTVYFILSSTSGHII